MSLFEGMHNAEVVFAPHLKGSPEEVVSLSLAIGMFDGVHRGHQAVIQTAIDQARKHEGIGGVLTFEPHPSRLFRPDNPTLLILPTPAKLVRLFRIGVDFIIVQKFDRSFASLEADAFLSFLKTSLPSLNSVHVGNNFRFGKGRRGDLELLQVYGEKLDVDVHGYERIYFGAELISSSRIRDALSEGRIEEVNTMLGWEYRTDGVVQAGEKLGRQMGFPTLNFSWDPECRPRFGVYAVEISSPDSPGSPIPGVANYGVRPTVSDVTEKPLLEVHCLQPVTYGPGDALEVRWKSFLRGEQKFSNTDTLKTQIEADVQRALRFFSLDSD